MIREGREEPRQCLSVEARFENEQRAVNPRSSEIRRIFGQIRVPQPLHHAVVRPERDFAVHHLLSAELYEQEKAVVTMTAVLTPTWLSRSPGAPRRLRQPGWKLFSRNTFHKEVVLKLFPNIRRCNVKNGSNQ